MKNNMQKTFKRVILFLDILIVAGIIAFIVIYSRNITRRRLEDQVKSFEQTTEAMEQVMTNFLLGEQYICNTWAAYINGAHMTMPEAIEYLRKLEHINSSAQIVWTDDGSYSGMSITAPENAPDYYSVSYAHVDILDTLTEEAPAVNHVNVTRTFVNPINGVQSLALCHPITLFDENDGNPRSAVLMRVIPLSMLDHEWYFILDRYKNSEITVTEENGDYVIKGNSFRKDNFFDFYDEHHIAEHQNLDGLNSFSKADKNGYVYIADSKGETDLLAYKQFESADNRELITFVPLNELEKITTDYTLIIVISTAVLVLLLINIWALSTLGHELDTTIVAANEANMAKKDFLSMMSHNIRTPMNAIVGSAAIAESQIDDREIVSNALRRIGLSSNTVMAMTNDILDIYELDKGKMRLNPSSFSIVEIAGNLAIMSRPLVREKNIYFTFHIDRIEHEILIGDHVRLNQVYMNILLNALQYTPENGKVGIDLREEIGSQPDRIRLIYQVTDNGCGISEEFQKHLFEPFNREIDSRINPIPGAGIGLAISKMIVDMMHGEISCKSEVGKGSTFTVSVELKTGIDNLKNLLLPSVHVLVADENEALRRTTMETLYSLGAIVETVDSGEEAIREILESKEDQPYDVVILGRNMPEMNGLETARQIHTRVPEPLPKLLVSAYDWSDIQFDAKSAGLDGFISKPLFRSTLYRKISSVLEISDDKLVPEDNSDFIGMNVLIVEDNEVNSEVLGLLLQSYGMTTEYAVNGRKAVERMSRAREGEISMIIMDILMPVMNGFEAAKAIRNLPGNIANTPIIAMSAETTSEYIEKSLESGMNGHIGKPVDITILKQEIRRVKDRILDEEPGQK